MCNSLVIFLSRCCLLHLPYVCLFCFVALRPKSTAVVIAGRSVHLTTLFSWASLNKQLTSNRAHTFACSLQQPFMNYEFSGREENDRRNYFMINLHESMGPGRDRTRDPGPVPYFRGD